MTNKQSGEALLSFHHGGHKDQTQVTRLDDKCCYPLSNPDELTMKLFIAVVDHQIAPFWSVNFIDGNTMFDIDRLDMRVTYSWLEFSHFRFPTWGTGFTDCATLKVLGRIVPH